MKVSEMIGNSYWSNLYGSSTVNNVNSANTSQNELDNAFQSLQNVPTFSYETYQTQQNQYRSTISNFTDSARTLNTSVKSFMSTDFSKQKSVSSTSTAVTGEAKTGATSAQYSVSVSQVAAGQRNEGKTVAPSVYGVITNGNSTFGIRVGNGAERQVSVNVSATDNNAQVLKKFASAINNSGADVVAEIKTKNNAQYLSITSKNTGAANGFAIRDINGSATTNLQLGNKVISAADAKYTVDGTSYQTATNKVTLDKGNVSLNLNATTTGNSKVNVGPDNSKIIDAAKKLVSSYNSLQDFLSSSYNNVTKRADMLLSGVQSLVGKTRAADFAAIGISLDKSTGDLQLDQKALSDALASDSDSTKKLLTGAASLGKAIERASKEISNTPVSSYLKAPNPLDSLTYTSRSSTSSWASLQTSLTQGLFFNMTV